MGYWSASIPYSSMDGFSVPIEVSSGLKQLNSLSYLQTERDLILMRFVLLIIVLEWTIIES